MNNNAATDKDEYGWMPNLQGKDDPGDGSNNDDCRRYDTFDARGLLPLMIGQIKMCSPCPDAVVEIGPLVVRREERSPEGQQPEDEALSTAIFVEGKDGIKRHTTRGQRMAVGAIRRSISADNDGGRERSGGTG